MGLSPPLAYETRLFAMDIRSRCEPMYNHIALVQMCTSRTTLYMHLFACHSSCGSSLITDHMESECAMALNIHIIAGASRHTADRNKESKKKPCTTTYNKKSASTMTHSTRCVTKKMLLKRSAAATQGLNYHVLQFTPGPLDCSLAPKVWRAGSACAGMLTRQLRGHTTITSRETSLS